MELITGKKVLDTSLPEEMVHLISWFGRTANNTKNIVTNKSLNLDNENMESVYKVVELAARMPKQRITCIIDLHPGWNLKGSLDPEVRCLLKRRGWWYTYAFPLTEATVPSPSLHTFPFGELGHELGMVGNGGGRENDGNMVL
ncbi:hypothetical protein V8G54_019103 [Vigna mungo]|uniref:Uncharacterized protein n=1 Tax=Vigna mungo TaxID=3915 RepID=A0AAQ3N9V8_VIGMU